MPRTSGDILRVVRRGPRLILLSAALLAAIPVSARADAIGQLCAAAGAGSCPGTPTLRGLERPERTTVERSEPCLECYRRRAEALARMVHLPPENAFPIATPDEIARAVAAQIERDDRRRLERLGKLRAALSGSVHAEPPDFVRPLPKTPPGTLADECRDHPEILQQLNDDVKRLCKKEKRACGGSQDCDQLKQNLQRNLDCLRARETRDDRCFAGGDAAHERPKKETRKAIAICQRWIKKRCP